MGSSAQAKRPDKHNKVACAAKHAWQSMECASRQTLLHRLSMYSAAPLTKRTLPLDELFLAEERVVTPLAVLLAG